MIDKNRITIIHDGPTHAKFYIDGMELRCVVSYQVNASCTEVQTITIVMQADVQIEYKIA